MIEFPARPRVESYRGLQRAERLPPFRRKDPATLSISSPPLPEERRMPSHRFALSILSSSLALALAAPSHAATPPPDAQVYTSYRITDTLVEGIVCGTTPKVFGCFGSVGASNFGHVGSAMEGPAVVDTTAQTVTRHLYVADRNVSGGHMGLTDIAYVEDYSGTVDITESTVASLALPLKGATNAKTYMAADRAFVYIGSDHDTRVVRYNKSTHQTKVFDAPVAGANVSQITTDGNGFIDIAWGGVIGTDGYEVFDAGGNIVASGAGAQFVAGLQQGLRTVDVLRSTPAPAADLRLHYRPLVPTAGAAATSDPTTGLYAQFGFNQAFTQLTWSVCGSVNGSNGCYGTGTLGGFGRIGALIQGAPTVDATTGLVTRNLYVIDQAVGGGTSTTTQLRVFELDETVAAPNVTVAMKEVKRVSLPMKGGLGTQTWLVGNRNFLIVGNSADGSPYSVAKSGLAVQAQQFNGTLEEVTTNGYGFVETDHDTGFNPGEVTMFYTYDANLQPVDSGGGGAGYFLNTEVGLPRTDVP